MTGDQKTKADEEFERAKAEEFQRLVDKDHWYTSVYSKKDLFELGCKWAREYDRKEIEKQREFNHSLRKEIVELDKEIESLKQANARLEKVALAALRKSHAFQSCYYPENEGYDKRCDACMAIAEIERKLEKNGGGDNG